MPAVEEFAEHLLDQQLRCHGLESVQLESGEVFLLEAGALDRPLPRASNRMVILSSFDNSVIQRERVKQLFQFDYQTECYVSAPKRQYGYFSLPLLFRDEFVGRMDCKAHRNSGVLEIKALHVEHDSSDEESFLTAFKGKVITQS